MTWRWSAARAFERTNEKKKKKSQFWLWHWHWAGEQVAARLLAAWQAGRQALVGEGLVTWSRRLLLQEGAEGGADGAAAEGLLHTEVVHHALLHLLLGRGEEQAAKHGQLPESEGGREGVRE